MHSQVSNLNFTRPIVCSFAAFIKEAVYMSVPNRKFTRANNCEYVQEAAMDSINSVRVDD